MKKLHIFLIYHIHLIQTWLLNVISAIRHLKVPVNLEDMFEVYMKTRDMNVEFVTNYLRDKTHLQSMKSCILG